MLTVLPARNTQASRASDLRAAAPATLPGVSRGQFIANRALTGDELERFQIDEIA